MAGSVNKVILIGNLGRDPEMRSFPSGDQVANVTLATTNKWRDKQTGEQRDHTVKRNGVMAGEGAQEGRRGQGRAPRIGP